MSSALQSVSDCRGSLHVRCADNACPRLSSCWRVAALVLCVSSVLTTCVLGSPGSRACMFSCLACFWCSPLVLQFVNQIMSLRAIQNLTHTSLHGCHLIFVVILILKHATFLRLSNMSPESALTHAETLLWLLIRRAHTQPERVDNRPSEPLQTITVDAHSSCSAELPLEVAGRTEQVPRYTTIVPLDTYQT
ncbi:hypothetical protein EDB87DRAFT_987140 [Lactarius vividus]|nr:hypothetical protein EDB87DRAFT_987140 [Lactarius vividus]